MKTMLNRGAGVLLPISSLPSPYGIGTLGKAAYEFVDFLFGAKQKYWQVLPVGPTSFGDSPYQSFSAFAGNPYFIDLDTLVDEGLISREFIENIKWVYDENNVSYDVIFYNRFNVLREAYNHSSHKNLEEYKKFCSENTYWLDDYSLYMACKFHFDNHEWSLWDDDIKFRTDEGIKKYTDMLQDDIDFWRFCQYKFYEQWYRIKNYANSKGIEMIGDIPIYVALDSADVWVNHQYFQLDKNLTPIKVAGVPPDAFSDDGQLWGNPLYDWDAIEASDFAWWKARMAANAKLYDAIRIDHFIGVVQYYTIPFGSVNGRVGEWVKGPAKKLTDAIDASVGNTKIIAEDLGVVIPDVNTLLEQTGYPGMKILEFAFGSDAENEHLPHNYNPNILVYGGTHDNETIVGFIKNQSDEQLSYLYNYFGISRREEILDKLIVAAYQSVASVVIFQAQDILGLDNSARMNFPSTVGTNWKWRLSYNQLGEKERAMLSRLVELYGR